jgi:GH15 family glucan-1,4-alpha-glucosidase
MPVSVRQRAEPDPATRSPAQRPALYTPLQQYAVIGNCRTAALISLDGSIDWLCLPHFSGASVFGALLDHQRGGRFRVRPRDIVRMHHRYVADSNVLETHFECRNGALRLTDFMTILPEPACALGPQPQHELVRLAECTDGVVELEADYQPRPADAAHVARLARRGALGWTFSHAGTAVYLHSDMDLSPAGPGRLQGSLTMHAGERSSFVLAGCENEAVVIQPRGDAVRDRLQQTVAWWQSWARRCRYDGPYRDAVVRSCLTLKLLNYCLSGAIVAAPTTSLPEKASGGGNWDYRYCWLRDASLVLTSFLQLGYAWESRAFLEWLLHATRLTQPRLQVLYDVYGETALREREVGHLEGYQGVGPVRVGNAAHSQFQLDIYGEVVLAAYHYVTLGGQLDRYERKLVAGFGDVVRKTWRCPDQGIWEVRSQPRHHTYSKLMCWVALDRIVKLHRQIGLGIDEDGFRRACQDIRSDIEAHGYDAERDSYVASYGGSDPDAALLLLARHQYIAPDHPRMLSTCRYIEQRLGRDGFLFRYPPEPDPENLFAPCTFWLVEYLANLGKIDDATRCFERLLGAATDLGLYAEEFDVRTKGPVGNFPQAFTHVALLTAALALEKAARQPRGAKAAS